MCYIDVFFIVLDIRLISRPLKRGLIIDYQQYNSENALINLQVFVSLGIETCRFL